MLTGQYSPRMRGWTLTQAVHVRFVLIFPADAGVNLQIRLYIVRLLDIPRGCGGEPGPVVTEAVKTAYSPRMRGWTWPFGSDHHIFTNIPRGCGGEPIGLMLLDPVKVYSPRMRGWTYNPLPKALTPLISPADAGVKRSTSQKFQKPFHILHGYGVNLGWTGSHE